MTPDINSALMSLVPEAEWTLINNDYSLIEWIKPPASIPSQSQVEAEILKQENQLPFNNCKAKAKELIATTDWAALPDVGLVNQADFIAYRASLRALIINPVADPVWPTEPTPEWG